MEAANRGAHDAGASSAGLGIQLRSPEWLNPYMTPQLAMNFHYFFMRKWWLIAPARAAVIFPGGLGTMDEMFELLALTQTRKIQPPVLILYGSEYWSKAVNFEAMAELGVDFAAGHKAVSNRRPPRRSAADTAGGADEGEPAWRS